MVINNRMYFCVNPWPLHIEFVFREPGWTLRQEGWSIGSRFTNIDALSRAVRSLFQASAPGDVYLDSISTRTEQNKGTTITYRLRSWKDFEDNVESIAIGRLPKELGLE